MAIKNIQIVKGDLIKMALEGQFDVIAHGCNCQSVQGAGIAKQMADVFSTDSFSMEHGFGMHPSEKLGNIDYEDRVAMNGKTFVVVNAYTQEKLGADFNILAFKLCMIKMRSVFVNAHIGLPMIGAGIGGGDWQEIQDTIVEVFGDVPNLKVTIVEYDRNA